MSRTRAIRRHHRQRTVARVRHLVRDIWGHRDQPTLHALTCDLLKNRKPCGKGCCNNPRHQWEQCGPWKEVRDARAADSEIHEYQGAT